ncbi:periplasmic binding protein-like II [Neocallimastix lanati (nom. inval.)]|uniref:Periplasmic binding protein-like II n=1 Tax=Neocallimastix californiae TaxID=1754190 RepID=A0A1Y2DH80_9FUNG|nr:periplasmic binding protein-like II [Neocallimastix sp. JGI-2020a]ORY58602.1 periplasmic binding protein-like II [Neocallimastix californiae]|eukprot:ORY58602.1 periplasmic binding protein-like II [Neocallimastix californiae]
MYNDLVNEFNKYSKENKLNIELDKVLFSNQNTTFELNNYDSTIDSLISRRSNKYDIYCFDPLYTKKYTSFMINLNDILPEEHMELYNHGDAKKTCYSNNQWAGLKMMIIIPLFQKYSILYSNKELLQRYNKNVPKTWKELLDTGKYILEEERKVNSETPLVAYNGLFTDLNSFTTLYELVYSYRNTADIKFPGFGSKEAIDAAKMIKQIKEEISSEGINAVMTGGMNIGISKYSSDEKRDAALTVLQFLTSERIQKEIVVKKYGLYTGMTKLYDDEEVCSFLTCSLVKEAQSIHTVIENVDNIDVYSSKIVKIFKQFLFEDRSAEDALKEIDDITRIYYISLKSSIGLTFFIILLSVTCLMLFTFILVFTNIFKKWFTFFSKDLFFIYCLGCMMIISSQYLKFGEPSDIKCQYEYAMLFIGISLSIIPIIYVLIQSFPERKKYFTYIVKYRILYILICIGIEVILNLLIVKSPISAEIKMFQDTVINKNYSKCTTKNIFGNIMILIDIILKFLGILVILFLSYTDWNMQKISKNLRAIIISIYSCSFSFLMLIIISYLNINDYQTIFMFNSIIIIFICLTNFVNINFIVIEILKRTNIMQSPRSIIKSEKTVSDSTYSRNIFAKIFFCFIEKYHKT